MIDLLATLVIYQHASWLAFIIQKSLKQKIVLWYVHKPIIPSILAEYLTSYYLHPWLHLGLVMFCELISIFIAKLSLFFHNKYVC